MYKFKQDPYLLQHLNSVVYKHVNWSTVNEYKYQYFNPLPVQFKSLLHGQEGCILFQWVFKFTYVPVRLSTFSPVGNI
jgi:hypothetical protein